MKRANLAEVFAVPESFKPPPDSELIQNTHYPNLNSLSFRVKIKNNTKLPQMRPFFEIIDVNSLGNAVLVCNDYNDSIWSGNFWGFEAIEDVGNVGKASYKVRTQSSIRNLKFAKSNMILVGNIDGSLQLWSTQAEVRSPHGYCLFNIGSQSEHIGMITSMDIFAANYTKAVTGGSDGCIKVWDMGTGDLYSMNTWTYGHIDSVTSIASSNTSEYIFASCSSDKSFKIWDYRQSKPVVNMNDKTSKYGLTSLNWTRLDESNEEIYIGDETGHVNIVDTRNMSTFLNRIKYFENPIHKIKFEQKRFVVLGNDSMVNVADIEQNCKIIYNNDDGIDFVRDAYWCEKNKFYTVGWNMQIKLHSF